MTIRRKSGENRRIGPPLLPSVSLIGYGNWGTALEAALGKAHVPVREIILRHPDKRGHSTLAKAMCGHRTTLADAALDAEVFWICISDAAIRDASRELSRVLARGSHHRKQPVVFHSSGALSSAELTELQTGGASVASVHPLMTFPQRRRSSGAKIQSLAGVPFAIEGDASACRIARKLVRAMGGKPFAIDPGNKVLYHALGTFASPLLVALLIATTEVGIAAGFTPKQARQRMRPIVERTIANFFHNGPEKSFSGPIARGDTATIVRHLNALRAHPQLQSLYWAFSDIALENFATKNRQQIEQALAGSQDDRDKYSASRAGRRASTA